jgi:hypothetical protein
MTYVRDLDESLIQPGPRVVVPAGGHRVLGEREGVLDDSDSGPVWIDRRRDGPQRTRRPCLVDAESQ